jgi:hypothetical protein
LPFNAAVTVTAIREELLNPLPVPVTVTENVPVIAVLLAVRVRVLEPTAGFRLNPAVTPVGRPEADKLTLPVKPFCGVTLIVLAPLAPCAMLRLLGDAERVKLGGALTVT